MKALALTDKAIREILLALRCSRRSTRKDRDYLLKLIEKIQQQSGGK